MNFRIPEAYELIEEHPLRDLHAEGFLLRHKRTGARLVLIESDDENKVFSIGFRTPPTDSTGVAHIIEHTVLCGSERFPVKDPFVELAKGSLNTFLNAMTYPDKTIYPLASCNDKDFANLMHVYLDAVFHPKIYESDFYFRQEGWHYELENGDDELTINGVVYNEMKGAYSNPDELLNRYILNSLYPDTNYAIESGGDPDEIPHLTYEAYIDFHRRYYHPSNSYIYLYGNMDMTERLTFLDEEYLSAYDALSIDSMVPLQKPFDVPKEKELSYAIMPEDSEKEATYLTYNCSVATSLDPELYIAMEVLDYALCSAPGAVLKQALIDKGIGKDVYSSYTSDIRQPFFSIVARSAEADQKEEFIATIRSVLEDQVRNGIDKKALLAGLNQEEFRYREADFGRYPRGLIYCLEMYDSWLYDDEQPFLHIEAGDTYRMLKKRIDEGYFEELVKKYLIDNPHATVLVMTPEKGMTERKEEELRKELSARKALLTPEERAELIRETKALREWQDTPDSEEDIRKIPMLERSDLKREAEPFIYEEHTEDGVRILHHDIRTNGIVYLSFLFDMRAVSENLYTYAGLLRSFLGMVDTEKYPYAELINEINIRTGGMGASINSFTQQSDPSRYIRTFEISVKVLSDHIPDAFALVREIIMTSKFDDEKRNRELLEEIRSRMQYDLTAAGHNAAAIRALSHLSETAYLTDMTNGLGAYRTVEALAHKFGRRKQKLIRGKLEELSKVLFRAENLLIDMTADREYYDRVKEEAMSFARSLNTEPVVEQPFVPEIRPLNEAFKTSGQVQYVCMAGNYRKGGGLEYTGALRLLKVMMGYDYLWNNIRVKGGAYGCMSAYAKNGDSFFVTYRDPHLKRSLDVFRGAAEHLRSYDGDERALTRFIIGAISEVDVPKTPAGKGSYGLAAYLCGATMERLQKDRNDLLDATVDDVHRLADYVEAFQKDCRICVVGTADKIDSAEDLFDSVDQLIRNYDTEKEPNDNPFGL